MNNFQHLGFSRWIVVVASPIQCPPIIKNGFKILEHSGKKFDAEYNTIEDSVIDNLSKSIACIICVSKEYHRNPYCKLLARYADSMINRQKQQSFEVFPRSRRAI